MPIEERSEAPEAPSAPWRAASVFTMGAVGLLCKGFLGLNKIETHGMDRFLKLLDKRQDPKERERGLITGMRLESWQGGAPGGLTERQCQITSPCTYRGATTISERD